MNRFVAACALACACDLPIDEEQIQGQIDERLDNLECQIQSRLSNATNIPFREMCNARDDDCDGEVDEDLMDVLCDNPCGIGLQHCIDGQWTSCSAPQPVAEVCDGIDNDCDGVVDNLSARGAPRDECLSELQECIGGAWDCVPMEPIVSCALATSQKFGDMRTIPDGEWSYTFYPVNQPYEGRDRTLTFTRVAGTMLSLELWRFYDHYEHDVMWSYAHELFAPIDRVRVRADQGQDREAVGVTLTRGGMSDGFWHLDDGYVTVVPYTPATDGGDVDRLIPVVHDDAMMGVSQETSVNLPPAGHVVVHALDDDAAQVVGFARPTSVAARRYADETWLAWASVAPSVHALRIGGEERDIAVSGDLAPADVHFVEASEPRVAFSVEMPLHRTLSVHALHDDASYTYVFPLERRSMRAAQLADGVVVVSSVPHEDGAFSYVDVRGEAISWSQMVGRARHPDECDVSVVSDLSGYGVYVLCDDEARLVMRYVRCE